MEQVRLEYIWEHIEQGEDARVKQVLLVWVLQEDPYQLVEKVIPDHVANACLVFALNDCFEELDNFDVDLS